MTVKIYKSYGVLAHEKQPFYSISTPASDVYDIVAVDIPFPTWHNYMGDIGVTIDGVDYILSDILTNRGDAPVLMWYDGHHNHYKHLDIRGVI